jgi:predicted HTH domain antitoxin
MPTLTAEEVTAQPERLIGGAKRGTLTLVTDGGAPVMLAVPLEQSVPIREVLVELAAQLYDQELISLERAARIAGLSYSETIDEFGRRGIATIRITPEELERELAAFGP